MVKVADEISEEELRSLTNAIKSRYGIDFTNYETKSLARGFGRVISKHKLGSLLGLWGKVLRDREFFMSCMDDLMVNLTELFRNPEIWTKLRDEILEEFRLKDKLKIWHAGCSTGEEVYTMAVVLGDKNMLHLTDALATDLSSRALAKAMEGKYPGVLSRKYGNTFQKYVHNRDLNDVFDEKDDCMIVKSKYKKHVNFKIHNLVCDQMDEKFDVIFCRNVMIYFDDALKIKVLNLFYNSLNDGGYFIIGYYDMLPEVSKKLFEVIDSKTRIYKKIS